MSITVETRDSAWLMAHLDSLTDLLRDAVDHGAGVSFRAPLDLEEGRAFWRKIASETAGGKAISLVATTDEERVVGCVLVMLAWQPNAPHRAEIQKMLVHSEFRRQGIATHLMTVAERAALEAGRWLLYLDTERDGGAEQLYERMNYTRAGVIPQFAFNQRGEPNDTVFFYKLLR